MEHENPSGSKDIFPCEISNKTYINKLDHTRHKKSVHVENPSELKDRFPCELCNKTYQNMHDLTGHEKCEHLEHHLPPKPDLTGLKNL